MSKISQPYIPVGVPLQTFLPHPNFSASALVLDRQRLGKQRLECYMIMHYVAAAETSDPTGGWARHPAVRMWRGHAAALALYMTVVCREWARRGYQSTQEVPFGLDYRANPEFYYASTLPSEVTEETVIMPSWLGDPAFHAAHRSQLLRKDPEWYGQWGWTEEPGALDYVWPGSEQEREIA